MLEIHNFTQNEIDEEFLKRVAKSALKTAGIKDRAEISLAIVGDGRMRKLNKMYRGKNRVTDVLSFDNRSVIPYLNKAFPRLKRATGEKFIEPPSGIKRLGEIIICYPQAKKQAKRLKHSLEKEL
ncbi:MAG: rRNA maturation RNase YbeY, partial [Candidatus Portnoybacteria bacterium CG_4_10_14_0_2_um_filter_43_36]